MDRRDTDTGWCRPSVTRTSCQLGNSYLPYMQPPGRGRGFGDRENNSDILDGGGGDPFLPKEAARPLTLARQLR